MTTVLLTTIRPAEANIQLALYSLKAYFLEWSTLASAVDMPVMTFSAGVAAEDAAAQILARKPAVVGMSCYVWNVTALLAVATCLRVARPDLPIVVGGPEVSPRARQLLKDGPDIDVVVIGEGEETFRELVDCYIAGQGLDTVRGIAFRRAGKIVMAERRPDIANLDDIPSPYLAGVVDVEIASYTGYVPTETLRGCGYRCHYCYYHKAFATVRYFSLARVTAELQCILGKKPRGVYLMDPTFNVDRRRAKDVLRAFIQHNHGSNLHVELRAELLDEELCDLLRDARTDFIEIGIQSTNETTLGLMNRPFEPVAFAKNIRRLNDRRIPYEIQLLDSLPGDDYESLCRSVDWLFELAPSRVSIMRLQVIPGTFLDEHAADFGLTYDRYPPYFSHRCDTFSRRDLQRVESLKLALGVLHRRGLLRRSLFAITGETGLTVSAMCDSWLAWMRKTHRALFRVLATGGADEKHQTMRLVVMDHARRRVGELGVPFVQALYRRGGREPDAALLQRVEEDRADYLAHMEHPS